MTPLSIALICVFLQVSLTFWAIYRMGKVRIKSLKNKEVTMSDIALDTGNYPKSVQQYQNNTSNQFETPTLLYAVVAIGAATGVTNWVLAVGAMIYVASRITHRIIHVGSNHLRRRLNAFTVGLLGLIICWGGLALGLLNNT
jgi:hypothetical protein